MTELLDRIGYICYVFSLVMFFQFLIYITVLLISYSHRKQTPKGKGSNFEWHFLVPCRDEEVVIGATIDYLYSNFDNSYIWVIDDASEDSTPQIVEDYAAKVGDDRVNVVRRFLPHAREGKAHALNYAWFKVRDSMAKRNVNFDKAVVCVIDADGRPSDNLLDVCASKDLFGNDRIGAVQVEVRMMNRDDEPPKKGTPAASKLLSAKTMKTLVRMQDIEFRQSISAMQMTRKHSESVSIGGNGQLTRMSALISIADEKGPWKGALLEDFELGIHLLLAGWHNAYTISAWVDQEALYSLSRFVHQRARWAQGTMQCAKYIPEILRSSRIWRLGSTEMIYFMLQPWLQVTATIAFPIALIWAMVKADFFVTLAGLEAANGMFISIFAAILIGMAEFGIFGIFYYFDAEPDVSPFQSYLWGCEYFIYNYLIYPIAWKAFLNLLKGESG